MKQFKPKTNDNSWLGVRGVTGATLYDEKGNLLGTCMDTPNNVAFAMATNEKVSYSRGLLGIAKREDLQSRFWFVVKDDKEKGCHSKYVKWF